MSGARRVIVTADDFGASLAVNEAVEAAARHGILTCASLMMAGPAAADAVERARRLPHLGVGLHLVVIEGRACLPPRKIPDLVDGRGWFSSDQLERGITYYFSPRARRQLAAEIRAQFEAFKATGLALDHANAHKHMHLHPTVGRMMIEIGKEYGLRAIRLPREEALPGEAPPSVGERILRGWSNVLRRQLRQAGMRCNDRVVGLRWTGHMTRPRIQSVLDTLSPGCTEIYTHPAIIAEGGAVAGYDYAGEYTALLQARLPASATRARFSDL